MGLLALSVLMSGCASSVQKPARGAVADSAPATSVVLDSSEGAADTGGADAATAAIQTAAQHAVDSSGASVSVTYVDLTSGSSFSIDGSESRVSASVIKLVVLAELLDEVSSGERSLSDLVEVSTDDIVGGTGVIQTRGAGVYSLSTLATYMICESDNTAANKIIDLVGMDAVNSRAAELGLTGTRMERRMMDAQAIAAGKQNYMSTDDAATILRLAFKGELMDAESSSFMMSALEGQQIDTGVCQGVPAGVTVAHKTGDLVDVVNDAAIVECDQPYVLVVMATGAGSDNDRAAIAGVSAAVWDAR